VISSFIERAIERQFVNFTEIGNFWRRMLRIPHALQLASETRVGSTPHDVVFESGTLKLLHYRRETPARFAEPVLFCYALVNRHYILDLQPGKSVVERYLEQGFDVYMIDWGIPSDEDRHLTLHDYVFTVLLQAVDFVLREYRCKSLHLLGYCMGGTLSTIFTAAHPERIKSLTLIAAPIDFSERESLLSLWTNPRYFDVDAFVDAVGNCPAIFLQTCFLFMKPVQNLIEKHATFVEQLEDDQFITSYFAMESWVNDNIPVAGETFREFVKKLYQRNELVRGQLLLGDHRIDLAQIECPLLVLTARKDHLVPPTSTESVLPHVKSPDAKSMTLDAGHVGLVVGARAHKSFWPDATRWLAERSTARRVVTAASAAISP
jgi:polyhydroxyalkanoate synthase